MRKDNDIRDDEFRIIGGASGSGRNRILTWCGVAAGVLIITVTAALLVLERTRDTEPDEPGVFEQTAPARKETGPEKLSEYAGVDEAACTEVQERTINDIPLSIYIPHNAVPELCVHSLDYDDPQIVFATQAADIRADNGKILGAFVLKGEPLAWGLSKKGFCSIINGEMTVGVAESTPLFERATETGGYFFRQFPLVDNGTPVESGPKGKSSRKALCERGGEFFVVKSQTPESFHDFSQALVDLGVDNAIYLVGGTSYGFWRDKDGHRTEFNEQRIPKYDNESYILWRAKP